MYVITPIMYHASCDLFLFYLLSECNDDDDDDDEDDEDEDLVSVK